LAELTCFLRERERKDGEEKNPTTTRHLTRAAPMNPPPRAPSTMTMIAFFWTPREASHVSHKGCRRLPYTNNFFFKLLKELGALDLP